MPRESSKPLPDEDEGMTGFAAEVARYVETMTPEEAVRLEEAAHLDEEHGSKPEVDATDDTTL
jgi:hypothetical protein